MFSIFKKKEQENNKKENTLSFIHNDGKCWVSLDIASLDDQALTDFAEMLFYVNTGQYKKTITNILLSLCEEKPEMADKFETILKQWLILENYYTKSLEKSKINDPLIHPRDVFLGTEK